MSGVATPSETLKSYASTIEEARADLVGLYFLLDTKLEELGLVPSLEVGKNQYDMYIVNGLMKQLFRIKKGNNLEEAHMRNRQLIAKWAYENGKKENVIERICSDNKTFFKINNYEKLRNLFGILLKEIQRIKSEGDGSAAEYLVENYGVKVDADLHNEVLLRCEPLKITPYSGFVNPYLTPIYKNNEIIDINIHYPTSFAEQMLFYSQNYSSLI
jgi:dipeptidyl-peptidase-3